MHESPMNELQTFFFLIIFLFFLPPLPSAPAPWPIVPGLALPRTQRTTYPDAEEYHRAASNTHIERVEEMLKTAVTPEVQ